MIPENIALTIEPEENRCHRCNEVIKGEPFLEDDYGDWFCTKDCHEEYEESRNERAYEAFCEAFYGGEIETLDQEHVRLWEEKRRLS